MKTIAARFLRFKDKQVKHSILSFLLLILFLVTSCSGQNTTQTPKDSSNPTSTNEALHTKLVRTQGTNQYANVHCGLMDKNGNLWFGTTGEGVYRYDGKYFTQFTEKEGLANNFVWCVYEDSTGVIWFGTANGISRYDGKTFTNTQIGAITSKPTMNDYGNPSNENSVWSIIQDHTGKFWIGTTNGIYHYDGSSFTPFQHNDQITVEPGFSVKTVESIVEDRDHNIWFGGRGTKGVFRFDGVSVTNLKPNDDRWVWPVFKDTANTIWFNNWGYIYRYDGNAFKRFEAKDTSHLVNITHITEDKKGNIWIGSDDKTWGGLYRYDGKSITRFTTNDGLPNNAIWAVVEDRSGNIWLGTRNMGLCRYDGKTFTTFSE